MNTPTLNQIVFNIAENKADTSEVFIRRLKFTVLYYRAMFIRRDYSRNFHLPESILQEVVLDLKSVTTGSDNHLRTVQPLPVPIRLKGDPFQYFGGVDRKTPYRFAYPEERQYVNAGKFNCKPPIYSYVNGYGEVHNISAGKILIRHAFENPVLVGKLNNSGCVDDNSPFPIPLDMVEGITKGILSGELQVREPEADVAKEVTV